MSTHMTKTWFVDGQIIEQEIPEAEIYKREWVGLTGTEKHELRYSHMTSAEFIDAIEAKLKEKNT